MPLSTRLRTFPILKLLRSKFRSAGRRRLDDRNETKQKKKVRFFERPIFRFYQCRRQKFISYRSAKTYELRTGLARKVRPSLMNCDVIQLYTVVGSWWAV
jgi:hypothetical protein